MCFHEPTSKNLLAHLPLSLLLFCFIFKDKTNKSKNSNHCYQVLGLSSILLPFVTRESCDIQMVP